MLPVLATSLIASNSIFLGLAVIAVVLRVDTRRRTVPGLGNDDWLILVALFFAFGLCLTNIIGVPLGHLGFDVKFGTDPYSVSFLKFSYAWQFFYLFAVAFIKLSVLSFYSRALPSPRFLLVLSAFSWLVLAWLVSFFFATLFQAIPFYCNWTYCEPMSMDYPTMYLCSSATDVALDVLILVMPLSMLSQLQINFRKKLALSCIFSLGVFCVVASIARLVYTIRFREAIRIGDDYQANLSDSAVNIILWSGIEACASIICACLPCFGHVLTRVLRLNDSPFGIPTIDTKSVPIISDARFTGGGRERSRGRRLRLSGLSTIDTKLTASEHRGRCDTTESSSIERMVPTNLPSPLMTPRNQGDPTHRDFHEPEIELGKIHLRTGSDDPVDPF